MKYLNHYRVERAQALLTNTDESMANHQPGSGLLRSELLRDRLPQLLYVVLPWAGAPVATSSTYCSSRVAGLEPAAPNRFGREHSQGFLRSAMHSSQKYTEGSRSGLITRC